MNELNNQTFCRTSFKRSDTIHISLYCSSDIAGTEIHHSYCNLLCRYVDKTIVEPEDFFKTNVSEPTRENPTPCKECFDNLTKYNVQCKSIDFYDPDLLCISRGSKKLLHIQSTEQGLFSFCNKKTKYSLYDGDFSEEPAWCKKCLEKFKAHFNRELKNKLQLPKKKRKNLPNGLRRKIWCRDAENLETKLICPICNDRVMVFSHGGFEIGHIVAVNNGGTNHPQNLLCICPQCNSDMRDRHMFEFQKDIYPDVPQPVVKEIVPISPSVTPSPSQVLTTLPPQYLDAISKQIIDHIKQNINLYVVEK